jgi:succinoglycan biosynthesis transport protein ExoP
LELKEVLDAFRAKRAWIIGGVLVGLLLAALFNWTTERTYASTSQLFVNVPSPPDEIAPLDADTYSQQRMVSYIQVLTGREVAQRVVDELQLPLTAKMVQEKVSATPVPGTVILEIEVIDSSPERAQAIADSAGRQFASKIAELETPRQAGGPIVEIETLQAADFDAVPAAPGVRRNLMLGVALGLVVGLGLALLRSRMDRTLRLEADVREAADADLVGGVPEDRHLAARHVPADGSGQSAVTEAFRAIRVNLRRADGNGAPQVVVVTSSLPQEGASTVAVNLAVSFTRSGSRVILVDGNLRKPRVARYLGLTDGPGLTDVIAGRADLQQVTQSRENGTLSVLGAGHLSSDTDAVLDSLEDPAGHVRRRDHRHAAAALGDRRRRPQRPGRWLPAGRPVRQDHAGRPRRGHEHPRPRACPPVRRGAQPGAAEGGQRAAPPEVHGRLGAHVVSTGGRAGPPRG